MKRRMIAWVAVLCLIVGLLPTVSLAANEEETEGTTPGKPIVATEQSGLVCEESDYSVRGLSATWLAEEKEKASSDVLYISVVLPYGTERIAPYSFSSIPIPEGVENYKTDMGIVDGNDGSYVIVSVDSSTNDWLTEIGEYAFYCCNGLTSFNFCPAGDCLERIGAHAFDGCSNLTGTIAINAYWPNYYYSLEIGEYAFHDCSSVKNIAFNNYNDYYDDYLTILTKIGDYAFAGCTSLTNVDFSSMKMDISCLYPEMNYFGDHVFEGCTGLKSVNFALAPADEMDEENENYIQNLGAYTFAGCSSLETVIWPDMDSSLQTIGAHAFEGCTSLQWIGDVTDLRDRGTLNFHKDDDGEFTTIEIGAYAFANCFAKDLDVKISLPDTLQTVGEYAFASDRISQILINAEGTGWGDEKDVSYTPYKKSAFLTGNDNLLVVLKDANSFNSFNKDGQLSTDLKARIGYPITIKFPNINESYCEKKLYNQSLCYVQGDDDLWTYNEDYKLPGITPPPEGLPTGYVSGYTINEATTVNGNKTVYLDDSLLRFSTGNWQYTDECTMDPSGITPAQPKISYVVNDKAQTPSCNEVKVTLTDDEVGYIGVQVNHPLLRSESGDKDDYVYFTYRWWDEQPTTAEGSSGYPLGGARSVGEPELFSAQIKGGNEESTESKRIVEYLNNTFRLVETANAVIPISGEKDARMNSVIAPGQYLVEILGYHVKNGTPTLFYKSHHNTIDFGSDHDIQATTGSAYAFLVDVEQYYTVTFDTGDGTEVRTEKVRSGEKVARPADPTREGYAFGGWYLNDEKYDFNTPVTGTITLKAEWTENTHIVTFNANGGKFSDNADTLIKTVEDGGTVAAPDDPKRDGYTFGGWYTDMDCTTAWDFETDTVTADTTLYAKWTKDDTGGGGGGGTTHYTLTYDSNGGTTYPRESYSYGTTVQLNKVPTREGYQFTGWYADTDLTQPITSIKMTGNKTVYAGWQASTIPGQLNGEAHFAYVVGYEDGTVRPNSNISRAETATIFFRLLKDEVRDGNLTTVNTFEDVTEGMWCNTAISTMAELGIVKGRSADVFDPDANITRAEFAAICARFDTGITEGDSEFADISGHWAEEEIKRAVSLGWLLGYEDGTFRPDQPITRAEAMTIINRVLCRLPESEDDLLPGMNVWPDNQPGAWYYLAVQEATNSHDFQHKGEIYETWTALTEDPDWTRYEK